MGKCLFTRDQTQRGCGATRGPSFQVELLELQMYNQMFLPPAEEEKHLYFLLLRLLAGSAPLPFISRRLRGEDDDFPDAGEPRFPVSVKGRADFNSLKPIKKVSCALDRDNSAPFCAEAANF